MQIKINEIISQTAARAIRGGRLPHFPPPASPTASRVRLVLEAGPVTYPEIVFADTGREDAWQVAMQPSAQPGQWEAEILLPQEPTLLYYHFILADGTIIREKRQREGAEKLLRRPGLQAQFGKRLSLAPRTEVLSTRPLYGAWKEQDFRIAVYQPDGAAPAWVREQVIYQIFPDRFARSGETPFRSHFGERETLRLPWGAPPEIPPKSRDFHGGNLRGVIDHLDYLSSLGVTCIYFTPIFESPTNHRYDAIDYHKIDPLLGSEADLAELIEKARARGMRVLLDGVFNHCSNESIYFRAAQADRNSPYYRWFHFSKWPDQYTGWAGVRTMPEFVECPEVEDFFFGPQGVAQRWLALGTAGWRTDVTPWLSDEYWQRFRRAVRRDFPDAYLVAEDWADATKRLLGNSFDATMNYRFGNALIGFAGRKLNPLELDDRLVTLRRDTPLTHLHAQLNLLDSHDTARALTRLKGEERRDSPAARKVQTIRAQAESARTGEAAAAAAAAEDTRTAERQHEVAIRKLMLAVAIQMAYPGAPMLYSGAEAGQEGAFAEDSRRAFPWDNPHPTLLPFYTRTIHARRASRALTHGDIQTAWVDPRGGYAFLRQFEGEAVLAVFNNGRSALNAEIALPGAPDGPWSDLLGSLPDAEVRNGVLVTKIPAVGAGWFAPRK